MSGRSTGSGSSSRASGDYKEIRLPNSRSVKALIYFCGRDPRKAKSVRRYYDEDFDTRSTGSGGSGSSMFSWSSAASQVYLVESTAPYWYIEEPASVSYSPPPGNTSPQRKAGLLALPSTTLLPSLPAPGGGSPELMTKTTMTTTTTAVATAAPMTMAARTLAHTHIPIPPCIPACILGCRTGCRLRDLRRVPSSPCMATHSMALRTRCRRPAILCPRHRSRHPAACHPRHHPPEATSCPAAAASRCLWTVKH